MCDNPQQRYRFRCTNPTVAAQDSLGLPQSHYERLRVVARQKCAEEHRLDREGKLRSMKSVSDRIKELQRDLVYLKGMATAGKLSTTCFEAAAVEVNKSIDKSKEEQASLQASLEETRDPEQLETDMILFVLRCTAEGLHAVDGTVR